MTTTLAKHWFSEIGNLTEMPAINDETVNNLAANPTVVATNRQIGFLALETSLVTGASVGDTKSVIAVPSNARLALVRHASARDRKSVV